MQRIAQKVLISCACLYIRIRILANELFKEVSMILAIIILAAGMASAQTPAPGPVLRLSATTENVSGAPDPIRIDLLRWSSDAERDQLLSAWTSPGAAPAAAAHGGGRGGDGARGGGRGAAA